MGYIYTITDFYIHLKLGLFRGGEVNGWGYIQSENGKILRRPIECYQKQNPVMLLTNNTYLLDFYQDRKEQKNTYIIVISVSDHFQRIENKIYPFKLRTDYEFNTAEELALGVRNQPNKRKSIFKKKKRQSLFDASPLNSIYRKY